MPELHELGVAQAAQRIRDRQLSPVELMESLLSRIDALEPQLNAWVYLDRESVLSDAQQKEAEVKDRGLVPAGETTPTNISLERIRELGL